METVAARPENQDAPLTGASLGRGHALEHAVQIATTAVQVLGVMGATATSVTLAPTLDWERHNAYLARLVPFRDRTDPLPVSVCPALHAISTQAALVPARLFPLSTELRARVMLAFMAAALIVLPAPFAPPSP
jgi:hypothetical protein